MSEVEKFGETIGFILRKNALPRAGRERSEAIAEAIFERLGETKAPSDLGRGSYANVYWLKGNRKRILKITSDSSDAFALKHLQESPKKSLVKVHDVFEIVPKHLWGAVTEKLSPLSSTEYDNWQQLREMLEEDEAFYDVERTLGREGVTTRYFYLLEQAKEKAGTVLPTDKMLESIFKWGKDLSSLGIKFTDLTEDNIMKKGANDILIDLGYSDVRPTRIPALQGEGIH